MKRYLVFLLLFLSGCNSTGLEGCRNATPTNTGTSFISSDLTYVNTNTKTAEEIEEEIGHRGGEIVDGEVKRAETYQPESLYYSADWDVLYVSYYNQVTKVGTNLTSQDLIDLEQYIFANFGGIEIAGVNYRFEYAYFIKIIRFYPDADDTFEVSGGVQGISSANQTDSFIDVYHVKSDNIYATSSSQEPRINILAHEYGHAFNYYNLHLDGLVSPQTYLKIRLGDDYKRIYPNQLPVNKKIPGTEYYIWPTEIEADDYVELFFRAYDPATYRRQSLKNHPTLQTLQDKEEIRQQLLDLYQKTINYQRAYFAEPKTITSNCNSCRLTYYSDNFEVQHQVKAKYRQNLIATEARLYQGQWYYKVILSPLYQLSSVVNHYQTVASRMGFVLAGYYEETNLPILTLPGRNKQINFTCPYSSKPCTSDRITGRRVGSNYPFSLFIDLKDFEDVVIMYDYLELSGQLFSLNRANFN